MNKRKTDEDVPRWSGLDYVLVIGIVVFALIVILALMGPAVGTVYSNDSKILSR